MANENSSSNFTNNGIVLAALAVSGALYFYHNRPLRGARPEMTETQLHETAFPAEYRSTSLAGSLRGHREIRSRVEGRRSGRLREMFGERIQRTTERQRRSARRDAAWRSLCGAE
jgi:hypothetical protein